MPKVNREKASDATVNPPHPGDPTSDVTRDGGEPLHKPPQAGAWRDDDGVWHAAEDEVTDDGGKMAAVPSGTGRAEDGSTVSPYLGDSDQAQEYRDDPMPDGAVERVEWAQRGATPGARVNAALQAEEARTPAPRTSVLRKLRDLRTEARRNDEPTQDATATVAE